MCYERGVTSRLLRLVAVVLFVSSNSCSARNRGATLSLRGSDTLVQVATAGADRYAANVPSVSVNASGGGSGTGIAGLFDGTVDIATSSREMKEEERLRIRQLRNADVHEHVIGYDAIALYVHPTNPLRSITLEQLGEVWAEAGTLTDWSQLTAEMQGKFVLIGRQNSSGTYDYFRELVCGVRGGHHREFRNGVSELSGSSEVVEKVAGAPLALGYTGMGYKNERVRWLAIETPSGPVQPSLQTARDRTYPIARKLFLYTVGEPSAELRAFLAWTLSPEGQGIVAHEGYVPVQ